jgi:hypothetical protein
MVVFDQFRARPGLNMRKTFGEQLLRISADPSFRLDTPRQHAASTAHPKSKQAQISPLFHPSTKTFNNLQKNVDALTRDHYSSETSNSPHHCAAVVCAPVVGSFALKRP